MNDMIRIGDAPPGSTPFYKHDGRVCFDGQNRRQFDYGHTFDRGRGYRVYFRFRDTSAANTWGPQSLLDWCNSFEPADDEQQQLQGIARRMARQCLSLNREWERLGRPVGGVPTEAKGSA